jgi:D-erythro-7,8-dihydroneopterin triphosphate epimerase
MTQSPHAWIRVKNLRLRTFIGFNPEEQEKRQDVVINLDLGYWAKAASDADAVEQALNYKTITKAVINHIEQGRFMLLERLAVDVLEIALADPKTLVARVEVDKPNALRFADSVSIVRWGQREEADPALTRIILRG